MELILDIFTGICFFIGSLSIIIGACGLIKLILIGVFIFFTSPVTSHVTANLARQKNILPVGKKIGKIL